MSVYVCWTVNKLIVLAYYTDIKNANKIIVVKIASKSKNI